MSATDRPADKPLDAWSRRKARVRAEEEALARRKAQAETERQQAALAEKTDEEILAELNLPDPDSLETGDDIAGFMQATIPERLRRRALRKLWTLNPVLANVDGLVDYGEDFTGKGVAGEVIETIYKVGRGMLGDIKDDDAPVVAAPAEEQPAEQADGQPLDVVGGDQPDDPAACFAPEPEARTASVPEEAAIQRRPRRMRFSFDDTLPDGT